MLTLARRAWAAPIAAHLVALLLVLAAGAFYVGTRASLSEDEGAAIVQARQLSEHHQWIRSHPHPELDPLGKHYPYELSERGDKGFAPFAKHPLYALALAAVWPFGGINALIGVSIAGTLAAALAAALLARRLEARFERPALWAVGVGSPLLFDGFLVIAHTVGAAFAGFLVLLLTRRSERYRVAAVFAAAVLAAILVFMRTEGVLFVGAAAVVAVWSKPTRWMGLSAGAAGVLARFVEKDWTRQIVGRVVSVPRTAEEIARERALSLGGGGMRGRLDGAILTLFRPDYKASTAGALLIISFVALVAAVLVGRRDPRLGAVCGVLAATLAVLRLVLEPASLVPGLFVATPIVWAGLWAALAGLRDGSFRVDPRLVVLLGGFSLGVMATQYARGGGVEWGGRFFALALPVALPLAVAALAKQPAVLQRCVMIAAASLSLVSLQAMHHIHAATDELFTAVEVPKGAIPVTTAGLIPRLDWQRYDDRQWLLVDRNDAADFIGHLNDEGVRRVFLLYSKGERPEGIAGIEQRVAHTRWRTINVELD